MTTTVATAKDRYLAEFQALERRGAFRIPSWLAPRPRPRLYRSSRSRSPIELVCVPTPRGVAARPRTLCVAGRHSRLTVVERYVGITDGAYFTTAATEIVAGPGAAVDHYVVQEQGADAFHVATVHAALERDSTLAPCEAAFGGRRARTTLARTIPGW